MLRTSLAAGRLHRVRPGVFLDAALWPEDPREQHLLRAVAELVKFPAGVLSHESAGVAWNLPSPDFTRWEECPTAITLPRGERARSRRGSAVHHVGQLPPTQVTRDSGGRPVTGLARTAVDLAAGRPLPEALVILDAAARRLCSLMIAEPRRRDYANPRLIAAARVALTQAAFTRPPAGLDAGIELADPRRESAAESLSAGWFEMAGIPAPRLQFAIESPHGVLYPDFYWPERRLVGECDGAMKYVEGAAYLREKEREQTLRDLGYDMVRWLAKEIMLTPQVVVQRVGAKLT